MSQRFIWCRTTTSCLVVLIIFSIFQGSLGAPQQSERPNSIDSSTKKSPPAKILRQINKVNDDGSYTYGYEADDGSFKVETRNKDGVVKGKYGFVDANGELKTIEYSAGVKAKTTENYDDEDVTITAATANDAKLVQKPGKTKKQTYSSKSDNSGEGENDGDDDIDSIGSSENGSTSSTSGENDDDFDSFGPKKESSGPSELSKRQGEVSGGGDGSSGEKSQQLQLQQRERQAQQGLQQQQYGNGGGFGVGPGTTHLPGGQFRGPPPQYVDPQYQPQQGQGFIPQNPSGFLAQPQYQQPQQQQQPYPAPVVQYQNSGPSGQRPVQYVQAGRVPPQSPYQQGEYYPEYFAPHFSRGQSGQIVQPQIQHQPQQPQGSAGLVDEEGYLRNPPPPPQAQFFRPQSQPYQPGEGPTRYPSSNQFQGFGRPIIQHIGGANSFNQFPVRAGSGPSKDKGSGESDYNPSIELDGFSEDVDQDGFVDAFPGGGGSPKGPQQSSNKPPQPSGQRIQGPQIKVQPGLYHQTRPIYNPASGPGLGPVPLSPYNEQELQQIYPTGPGNQPQSPISRPVVYSGGPGRPQQQQQQSYPGTGPGQQYYSPQQQQPQFGGGGGPQYFDGHHHLHHHPFESPVAYFPQEHIEPGYYPGPQQQQQQPHYIQGNRFNSPFGGFSPSYLQGPPSSGGLGPGNYHQYPQSGGGVIPGQAVQLTPTPGAVTVNGGGGGGQHQQQASKKDNN